MTSVHHTPIRVVAVLIVFGVLLFNCGGGGSDDRPYVSIDRGKVR